MIKELMYKTELDKFTNSEKILFSRIRNEAKHGLIVNLRKICCCAYGRDYFLRDEFNFIIKLMQLDIMRYYKEGYYCVINPYYCFEDECEVLSFMFYDFPVPLTESSSEYYSKLKKRYCEYPEYCEENISELAEWNQEAMFADSGI